MERKQVEEDQEVIDASVWLEEKVESLVLSGRYDEAIGSLKWLATSTSDEEEAKISALSLGYLFLLTEEYEEARQWLSQAEKIGSKQGVVDLLYGLGHGMAGLGDSGAAMVYFLEAFVEAEEPRDEAECLRSAALALLDVEGPSSAVVSILLGALDRDLGNPWILEALVNVYKADERWLESLDILATLSEIVKAASQSVVPYRAPSRPQILRDRLLGQVAGPEDLQQEVRAINRRLRSNIEVVLDARSTVGPTGIAPASNSGAKGRLLKSLEGKERSLELIESAQRIWALASYEGFGDLLGSNRMAAAIEVLVERLHWRKRTEVAMIARRHGAAPESVGPAARLIVGRLGLSLFGRSRLSQGLRLPEKNRLLELNQALLFGESLETVRKGTARLG